ncbi:unnamed protein product, partial [Ectocarpus fasciculatus]
MFYSSHVDMFPPSSSSPPSISSCLVGWHGKGHHEPLPLLLLVVVPITVSDRLLLRYLCQQPVTLQANHRVDLLPDRPGRTSSQGQRVRAVNSVGENSGSVSSSSPAVRRAASPPPVACSALAAAVAAAAA